MTKYLLIFILVIFQSLAFALESNWLDSYKLTPVQIGLLKKWEAERRFDEEKLVKFAKSFEHANLEPKIYVPPHTFQELLTLMRWAEGAAFATFAPFAGFHFDNEAYSGACPNRALFNFGRATGKNYLQFDVTDLTYQRFSSLQMVFIHHRDTFAQEFLKQAKKAGFDIYLSPLNK